MSSSWDRFTLLSVDEQGGILTIRLNREAKRNALSIGLMEELRDIAREIAADSSVSTVILRGADTFFSAGADLTDRRLRDQAKHSTLERRLALKLGPDMCEAWERLETFTIAAIEGYCVGGAVALAVACDMRICGASAFLRLPEVPLGMNMSWHSQPRLINLVGPARAKQFIIFGEKLPAEEALKWGMIEEVAPNGMAFEHAMVWARKIEKLPPIPVRMTKESVNAIALGGDISAIQMDRDQYLLATKTDDFKESVSAFLEKREPTFKGD